MMTIQSMTGFARRSGAGGAWSWTWEARSVNGRGLDLRFRLPTGFDGVEAAGRALAAKHLQRGNVSFNLSVSRVAGGAGVSINRPLLDSLIALARDYADTPGVTPPSLDGLLAVRGVVEASETELTDTERVEMAAAVLADLEVVVAELVSARRAEGRHLHAVLSGQIDEIEALRGEAERNPARSTEAIRQRLADQVALLAGREDIDPARLHVEAALLAAKADVREEIDRLSAHVAQARELLGESGAVGRKLDFLAQEFNREANTLCSKSNDAALTRVGLALKAVVDQLKEQVQNIE
jgi:uncharacterized protein (TIGR00255 family)